MRTDLDEEGGEAAFDSVVQKFKDGSQDIRVFGIGEGGRLAFTNPVVHFREMVRRVREDKDRGRGVFPMLKR